MTAEPPLSHTEDTHSETPDIRIRVNGEDRVVAAGTVLAAYLAAHDVPARFVAVAVNNEVVRRADHAGVVLHDGDVVEIVRMVGGGSHQNWSMLYSTTKEARLSAPATQKPLPRETKESGRDAHDN